MNLLQRCKRAWVQRRKQSWMCGPSRVYMRMHNCIVPNSTAVYGLPNLWKHEGKVVLGERVMLNSLAYIYRIGQEFRCSFGTSEQGVIIIGDDSGINGTAMYSQQNITIGKRVMIGAGTRITDAQSHSINQIPRRYTDGAEGIKPVVIEDDVWIGVDVMILPGVTIGRGAVIGAKSVVTKNIPPMTVAVGSPAKVVRKLKIAK